MIKVKLTILHILLLLFATLEFLWSTLLAIGEAIGEKLNELVDCIEAKIKKAKS
jgi:hypothetical protein